MPLAVKLLVITGAGTTGVGGGGGGWGTGAATIASAKVALPVPPAFAAEIITLKLPTSVGVPLINPVLVFTVNPPGKPFAS